MSKWKHKFYTRKGLSHEQNNKPYQDFVDIKGTDTAIIAIVADGLGSLEYSQIASKETVLSLINYFITVDCMSIDENKLKKNIIDICTIKVKKVAEEQNISISQMDCTLLFVYIEKKQNVALIGQIGDGAICLIHKNSGKLFSVADKTQANTTSTIFNHNTSDFKLEKINLIDKNIVGFILTSDGLENELYLPNSINVKHKASLYFNAISCEYKKADSTINELLSSITSSIEYGIDDDISLAILSNFNGEIELPKDAQWLCPCGVRNELNYTRCHNCNKDFLDIYKDNIRERGGKAEYFKYLNEHPEEEQKILGLVSAVPKSQLIDNEKGAVEITAILKETDTKSSNITFIIQDSQIKHISKRAIEVYNSISRKKCLKGLDILLGINFFILGCISILIFLFLQPKEMEVGANFTKLFAERAFTQSSSAIGTNIYTIKENLYAVQLTEREIFVGNIDDDDMPNGYGAVFYDSGIQIGKFVNGKRSEEFIFIDKNGNKTTSFYIKWCSYEY